MITFTAEDLTGCPSGVMIRRGPGCYASRAGLPGGRASSHPSFRASSLIPVVSEGGEQAMQHIVRIAAVVAIAVLVPQLALAQVFTGQISGRVTDASGAVLPGVTVTATQTETKLVRTTVTNEVGAFTLPNLPIGPYRLEASMQGFQTYVQSGVTIQVSANIMIAPTLQLGDFD